MTPETTDAPGWGDSWGENWGGRSVALEAPPEIAMLGGPEGATLGPPYGGFMGPQRPPGYRLEITTGGGRTRIDDLVSLSTTRRHTAISDWSAVVPTRPNIDDRTLSGIRLTWGDTILFRGRLETVSGELNAPVVTVSGRGIAADLTRGDIDLNLTNVKRCDAIRQTWRQRTSFDATVIAPDDPNHPCQTRITTDADDGEYSGTPMEVLKQLHEESAMRFTVLHSRPGRNVESYPAGSRRRRHDWDVFGGNREVSVKGYANRVVVKGEYRSDGTRLKAVAEDEREIEAIRQRGEEWGDGRVTYPIDDPGLADPEKARAIAEATLADLVDKDTVGGSLDSSPTIAAPGYSYYIPEFGGTKPNPYGEGPYGEGPYGAIPGQYASLNKISYSISAGEPSCALDLSQRGGIADALEAAYGNGQ